MKNILLSSGVILLLMQGTASAYDYTYTETKEHSSPHESLYAGAAIGIAGGDVSEYCNDNDLSCISWKAFAGYRLNENLAFEGGYHNFLEDRGSVDQSQVKITALSLSVLGITSAEQFDMFSDYDSLEFFGKIGMAAWDSKVNYSKVTDGTDFLLGGGAQMKLGDNLGIRGEIEYLGADIDSTNYSAGLTYSTF